MTQEALSLPYGWRLINLEETSSTNEAVKELPPFSDKVAISAKLQTKGRGRLNRVWQSPKGNVYLSLCLSLDTLETAGQFSFLTALSLMEAIESLCPTLEVQCKWPNDILIKGKKVSGILLETDGFSRLIIGVGINLIAPHCKEVIYPITSLLEEGFKIEVQTMIKTFLYCFDKSLTRLNSEGFFPILKSWEKKAYGLGQPMIANLANEQIQGVFYGLNEQGCLLLQKENEIIKITAGDVFFSQKGEKNECL